MTKLCVLSLVIFYDRYSVTKPMTTQICHPTIFGEKNGIFDHKSVVSLKIISCVVI
jgi:hypothetical protein